MSTAGEPTPDPARFLVVAPMKSGSSYISRVLRNDFAICCYARTSRRRPRSFRRGFVRAHDFVPLLATGAESLPPNT